ncbi:unnamed protein product, partial [marine sediment metagenome]
MIFSSPAIQSPGYQKPGDFQLTTVKHFTQFQEMLPIFSIISNSNAHKQLEFEFKSHNLYPDIYNPDLIQKTTLLTDFSLYTVFELDYLGLIPRLVLLMEKEMQPRAYACI